MYLIRLYKYKRGYCPCNEETIYFMFNPRQEGSAAKVTLKEKIINFLAGKKG
jgi:hypothetical protein